MESIQEAYVVAYAKITTDKEGIHLSGVFFGGIGDSPEKAHEIARECVNTIRGGTILPRVIQIQDKHQVLEALYEASDKFESTTLQMQEANKILVKAQKLK
tara:strand:- start:612 stop:914 length:303 start_codon:yes stop_codon:yes gene_type:complete